MPNSGDDTDGHDGDDEEHQPKRDKTGRRICAATLAISCPHCNARNIDPRLGKLTIRKCGLRQGVQRWKCSRCKNGFYSDRDAITNIRTSFRKIRSSSDEEQVQEEPVKEVRRIILISCCFAYRFVVFHSS